jgi:HlyD family secretion protein
MHESEGVIQPGAPLLELGDPEALEIVVDVLTSDAVQIKSGSPVTVVEWGGAPLNGSVRLVEPSAFTRVSALGVEEQRVNAVVDLSTPYKQWNLLGDGYQVQAKIQVYRAETAVRVPAGALFRDRKSWAVFVIEAGVARLRSLDVARQSDQFAEVVRGVSPGDTVILHPSDRVKDGIQVQVR